jgi:hypothetical protein
MKEIQLTQGQMTIVDDLDYEELSRYKWHAVKIRGRFYAGNKSNPRRYMHRFVMKAQPGIEVDHINGNALDNRRQNLRLCTHKQNLRNQRIQTGFSSSFKGVGWKKGNRKWRSRIMVDGVDIHLGFFHSELLAAAVYNVAAKKYFGDFAQTNNLMEMS